MFFKWLALVLMYIIMSLLHDTSSEFSPPSKVSTDSMEVSPSRGWNETYSERRKKKLQSISQDERDEINKKTREKRATKKAKTTARDPEHYEANNNVIEASSKVSTDVMEVSPRRGWNETYSERRRKKRQTKSQSMSQEERDKMNEKRRAKRQTKSQSMSQEERDEINEKRREKRQTKSQSMSQEEKDEINEKRREKRATNKHVINEHQRVRHNANKGVVNAKRKGTYENMPVEQKRVVQQKSLENYHSRRRKFILKSNLRRYAVDVSDSEDSDCDKSCQTSSSEDSFVSCRSSASMSDTLLGYEDLDGDVWCNCGECAEARNAEDSDDESDMFQYCQPCTIGHGGTLGGEEDAAADDDGSDDHSYYSADEYSYDASYGDGSKDYDSDGMNGVFDDEVETDDDEEVEVVCEEISVSSDHEVYVAEEEFQYEMRCENCLRKQIERASSKYLLTFHAVSSGDITGPLQ